MCAVACAHYDRVARAALSRVRAELDISPDATADVGEAAANVRAHARERVSLVREFEGKQKKEVESRAEHRFHTVSV